MAARPLLSILLPVFNQEETVESLLTSILELRRVPFELVVIDDASTDDSPEIIQSLLEYYQHDHLYFLQHAQYSGRGSCLNEGILQMSGEVVWIPDPIESINESALERALGKASDSKRYSLFQGSAQPPESPKEWVDFLQQEQTINDFQFIWNWQNVPSYQRFFNSYIQKFHCLELAARIFQKGSVSKVEPFCMASREVKKDQLSQEILSDLVYTLLRRSDLPVKLRERLITLLPAEPQLDLPFSHEAKDHPLLKEAVRNLEEGRPLDALENAEELLEEDPDNEDAKRIKIQILEKQRRFVEAAELKHGLSGSKPKKESDHEIEQEAFEKSGEVDIRTSLIIPTAVDGKPVLERCLISVAEHCDPNKTELIVIDNASIDNTHDYLEQLKEQNFFNCRIITNKTNKGFAASVNQGLEMAGGTYSCIMHNDVELNDDAITKMEKLMDRHSDYAIIGPRTQRTLNPDQSTRNTMESGDELVKADYLDSFCMMIRNESGLRMDEDYGPAFFEDLDLCFQARSGGHLVGIARQVEMEHYYGVTTLGMGLDTESRHYWKNVTYFNEKWNIDISPPVEIADQTPIRQLVLIGEIVNPENPEEPIRNAFEELFTEEVKTRILKEELEKETLISLVNLMMVMEEREMMRSLEDKMEQYELPVSFINRLIAFYFNRNIYSRCHHYLDKLDTDQKTIQSELYQLWIWVEEKEIGKAVPKIKELMDKAPAHPLIYKLAGDIHQFEGNKEEAEEFYRIASQINPFDFPAEKVAS
ncbi:MAG: glycosyltransferase [Balneolaceae bacterium]|nr:glycosyltransferase [Balneolaceae bacterium]